MTGRGAASDTNAIVFMWNILRGTDWRLPYIRSTARSDTALAKIVLAKFDLWEMDPHPTIGSGYYRNMARVLGIVAIVVIVAMFGPMALSAVLSPLGILVVLLLLR